MITFLYTTIGIMSGTSLDGIDLAYIRLEKSNRWEFQILHAETIPYPKAWKTKLAEAYQYPVEKIEELNTSYTQYLAQIILDFISRNEIKNLDAVCSHGHTILHQPHHGITLQIGNQPQLAKQINQRVICDFRVQDVTLGGQGAPLVPIGDQLLFSEYTYCVNLGGFANISMQDGVKRIAYDVCPVNIVLNKLAERLGYVYDPEGMLAASGENIPELEAELNKLPYYSRKPPKSLGLEWVTDTIFPILEIYQTHPVKDVLHTFTMHVANGIARACNTISNATILFTGGGVYNTFLMNSIRNHTKAIVHIPEPEVIEFKEALIFGFLGILRMRDEVNCLGSVTGASRDHSSGNVFVP